jgi:hypothetical protein
LLEALEVNLKLATLARAWPVEVGNDSTKHRGILN